MRSYSAGLTLCAVAVSALCNARASAAADPLWSLRVAGGFVVTSTTEPDPGASVQGRVLSASVPVVEVEAMRTLEPSLAAVFSVIVPSLRTETIGGSTPSTSLGRTSPTGLQIGFQQYLIDHSTFRMYWRPALGIFAGGRTAPQQFGAESISLRYPATVGLSVGAGVQWPIGYHAPAHDAKPEPRLFLDVDVRWQQTHLLSGQNDGLAWKNPFWVTVGVSRRLW